MTGGERYRQTYRFGPIERRGIAGGLRAGQVLVLAAASLLAVVVFRRMPTTGGLGIAVILIAAACAASWLPVRGRHLDEWAPVVSRWLWLRAGDRHAYRSEAPRQGMIADLDRPMLRRDGALPPALKDTRLLALPLSDGREAGVFADRRQGTFTAVLAVRVRSFGLLAAAEQERRLLRWGRVIASLARDGGAVRRLQLLERTLPHDEDQLRRWLERNGDATIPPAGAMRQSYEALLANASDVTQDHEVLVAVQIDPRRARGSAARGESADARAHGLVVREVRSLAERIEASEAGVVGACTPAECARLLRLGFEPFLRRQLSALAPGLPGGLGVDPSNPGPTAADARWDRYRCDGAVHRTFWVAQWPRLDVGPAFLAPLLLTQAAVRSFSVIVEPVSPRRSRSAVEAAITSDDADEQLRQERGFRTTARRRSQQAATRRRESELAEGHEEVRFAGYLVVTARDDEELERSCDEVVQAAQQAYMDLQPMYGEQDTAFVAGALPLCQGLARGGLLS